MRSNAIILTDWRLQETWGCTRARCFEKSNSWAFNCRKQMDEANGKTSIESQKNDPIVHESLNFESLTAVHMAAQPSYR